MAIDAALYSGSESYFLHGSRYLRVTRGDTGPGTVDSGYPAPISNWRWPGGFGAAGIDAALYSDPASLPATTTTQRPPAQAALSTSVARSLPGEHFESSA